jgi:hypothetical protein
MDRRAARLRLAGWLHVSVHVSEPRRKAFTARWVRGPGRNMPLAEVRPNTNWSARHTSFSLNEPRRNEPARDPRCGAEGSTIFCHFHYHNPSNCFSRFDRNAWFVCAMFELNISISAFPTGFHGGEQRLFWEITNVDCLPLTKWDGNQFWGFYTSSSYFQWAALWRLIRIFSVYTCIWYECG